IFEERSVNPAPEMPIAAVNAGLGVGGTWALLSGTAAQTFDHRHTSIPRAVGILGEHFCRWLANQTNLNQNVEHGVKAVSISHVPFVLRQHALSFFSALFHDQSDH